MKKGLVILVVLAFAAPLYADVNFNATDNGDGTCTITWTSTALPIVAMGLDVDVTGGEDDIGAVAVDSFFEIFMDSAYGDPCNYNYGDGTPIADQDVAGEISLPSSEFCISMGGLGGETDPCEFPALTTGTIVLTADGTGVADGDLGANALRGGVIDEDGAQVATNLPILWDITNGPTDCMTDEGIDSSDPVRYTHFLAAGSPECWCEQRQCHGDADNAFIGTSTKTGYYAVGLPDLTILLAGWAVLEVPKGIGIAAVPDVNGTKAACANFDNDAVEDPLVTGSGTLPGGRIGTSTKTGYYYIGIGDLNILLAYWSTLEEPKGIGVPDDCDPGSI